MTLPPKKSNFRIPRVARAALWILYAVAGWFLLIRVPTVPPEPSVDVSWATVLHYAWAAHWQFGRDIVFNYGPLGFLHVGIYMPETWPWFLAFQVVQRAFYIALVCRLGLRLPQPARLVFLFGCVLFPTIDSDSIDLLFVTLAGALLCSTGRWDRFLAIPAVLFLSIIALIKVSFLCLVLTVVACVLLHFATQRRWLAAMVVLVAFPAAFATMWVGLARQAMGNLPIFFRNAFEISNAYQQGMTWPPSLVSLASALVVLLLLLVSITKVGWREGRAGDFSLTLMLLGALFLAWKQGFIRADIWHTAIFFSFAMSLSIALPVFFPRLLGPTEARRYWGVVVAVAVLALCGGIVDSRLSSLASTTRNKLPWLFSPFKAAATLSEKAHGNRLRYALPKIRSAVGSSSVDVFGLEQHIALLNDLNYRPPPVFQGYQACTRKLADLNVAFYRSSEAPEFVLFKLQSIDGRFPTLDNSRALLDLFYRYQFVLEEDGFLLLHQKAPPEGGILPMQLIANGQIIAGESLTIPNGTGTIWCELDIRENFLGRLTRLTWAQPPLFMRLIPTAGSSQHEHNRIIPSLTRGGFVLSPFLTSTDDFRTLLAQNATDPTNKFDALVIEPTQLSRWLFRPRIKFAIYRIP